MGASTDTSRRVRVELGTRAYDVTIGEGLLERAGEFAAAATGGRGGRAFLVVDAGVPGVLAQTAAQSLASVGFRVARAGVTPSEEAKSILVAADLLRQVASTRHERADPVVAIGGGIVGDLAGFVAATYRRGVPVVQCPTTLLSMVDASVGGKTGVNLDVPGPMGARTLRKNLVGAFHQPAAVIADVRALASLPDRVYRAGLAECVKHGLIAGSHGDAGLLTWIEGVSEKIVGRADSAVLAELIARNVAVKARVVAADEREAADEGGRAELNLGHTFAHAIETIETLSPIGDPAAAPLHHGEAVSIGLVAACRCAAELGLAGPDVGARAAALLERLGLPVRVAGLPAADELIDRMFHDKKVARDRLRLVLPIGDCRVRVVDDAPREAIRAAWDAVRA